VREPVTRSTDLQDEAATAQAGALLAAVLLRVKPAGLLVTLSGELGAGKTTLVRGLLRALGVQGPVRSPTYTLIESYPLGPQTVEHMDWYRLGDAFELEAMGFRDLLAAGHWVWVEWPERVPEAAERADLSLALLYDGDARRLMIEPRSPLGEQVLYELSLNLNLE
jgi:tRNA threonylcarbamoyladenosine biosynthesis protein TsaE